MTDRADRGPGDDVVVAGFVDLQINGVGAVDFWRADPSEWRDAGHRLLTSGTTHYLPTLPTGRLSDYDAALDRIAAARADSSDDRRGADVAHIVGVHLEGPFLGAAPGAHPPDLIRSMDAEWLAARLDRHPGLVSMVTLAPEADPSGEGIAAATERGVIVALGHSRCSYDEAAAAAEAGARLVTHLFNAMGPRHHRDPGLVGAALDPWIELVPTLIADGVHVHPAVVRAIDPTRCILVSDTVAVGTPVGGLGASSGDLTARGGAAYLGDGTLAGATVSLDGALSNVIGWGWAPDAAMAATSQRPGALLREHATTPGELEDGEDGGDRLHLDPKTFAVRSVWRAGIQVYGA